MQAIYSLPSGEDNVNFDDEEEDPEMAICPVCPGYGFLMGILGQLKWFRCRSCGFEFNHKK
jgi:hypothetical protein